MSEVEVREGQVWADNDRRSEGRTLRVKEVGETHALCVVLTNIDGSVQRGGRDMRGCTTRIALRRFKPTSTGYRLTEQAPNS